MSDTPQNPQADADEQAFHDYMARAFGSAAPPASPAPAPPAPPAPPSPPAMPDRHGGPRQSPQVDDDAAVAGYLAHYFPGQSGRPAA